MKILTTMVVDHTVHGQRGISFAKKYKDISLKFKQATSTEGGLTDDGLRLWVHADNMIFAIDDEWQNRDNGDAIRFTVLLFKSKMEQALEDMGFDVAPPVELNITTLSKQLINTYHAMGVKDWVKEGMPTGVRSVLAYRYGYKLDKAFNDKLTEAMKIVDELN